MIQYKMEYLLSRMVGLFARHTSLQFAHRIGDLIGDLFFYVIRIRRDVAYQNLSDCFGTDKSPRALQLILRKNYRHFGRVLMEFARLPILKRADIVDQIPVRNIEHFEAARRKQRGLFVMSGHFGNWEYMAAAVANLGMPAFCVFKEQKNLAIDGMIKEVRMGLGLQPFKVKGGAARGILSALKQKGLVIILIDQDAGRKGMMIDFLGKPASTNPGPAIIAIKHRVPVVMAFGVREADGKIRVHFEPFPDSAQFADNDDGVKQFIIEYNKILERYIRQYPEQWFWMHRRWKTKAVDERNQLSVASDQ
ncbi:MAG: lysophospholipid acyltransferase family protein [candidate division KSB1 bacterium]|nr:lysophospholipid acyltransferase family protein [candidate division KSB1 bacterium]